MNRRDNEYYANIALSAADRHRQHAYASPIERTAPRACLWCAAARVVVLAGAAGLLLGFAVGLLARLI